MKASTWTVADAKAKLSEVIDLARSSGPQTITRNGRFAVVIVAAEEWEWNQTYQQSRGILRCIAASGITFDQTSQRSSAQDRSMNFLLDTTVVSELMKTRPNRGVIAWLAEADEDRVFISVVTLAELRYGIERIAPGRRQKRLDEWLRSELQLRFEGRVLSIDGIGVDNWGKVVSRSEVAGGQSEP